MIPEAAALAPKAVQPSVIAATKEASADWGIVSRDHEGASAELDAVKKELTKQHQLDVETMSDLTDEVQHNAKSRAKTWESDSQSAIEGIEDYQEHVSRAKFLQRM